MEKAEIRIVVTPEGFDRTEVVAPKLIPEQSESIMKAYGQIAFEIHKFRREVNKILDSKQEEANIHITD